MIRKVVYVSACVMPYKLLLILVHSSGGYNVLMLQCMDVFPDQASGRSRRRALVKEGVGGWAASPTLLAQGLHLPLQAAVQA